MKIIYFIFFVFLAISFNSNGQDNHDNITRRGYLIYFGVFGWYFQPCDNPNKTFQESLNSASFSINYGTDGFNDVLRNFEKTNNDKMHIDTVFYNQISRKVQYVGELKYKYVKMKYKNEFLYNKNTQNIPMCTIEFSMIDALQKQYKLGCFWFDSVIYEISPLVLGVGY